MIIFQLYFSGAQLPKEEFEKPKLRSGSGVSVNFKNKILQKLFFLILKTFFK